MLRYLLYFLLFQISISHDVNNTVSWLALAVKVKDIFVVLSTPIHLIPQKPILE